MLKLTESNRLKEILSEIQQFLAHEVTPTKKAKPAVAPEPKPTTKRQYQQRIRQRINQLHDADIAHIIESLPIDERLSIWTQIPLKNRGDILLQLTEPVRESLIDSMPDKDLIIAAENLDSDEIADLADLAQNLPDQVVDKIIASLSEEQSLQFENALSYPEGSVGSLMDFSMTTVSENATITSIKEYLQSKKNLPPHTHHLFVINKENELKGVLPLQNLVTLSNEKTASEVMINNLITFRTDDSAKEATLAFERYELSSAPVIDDDYKLIGRLCINEVMNFLREDTEAQLLKQMGLSSQEDKFSGIMKGAVNRWFWLAVNLACAFAATRVITLFEDTIAQLLMLATLMPIVAYIGGNIGNQSCTLMIRALALGQITPHNIKQFYTKELGISLINGGLWGGAMGLFVGYIYQSTGLGMIMFSAIVLNILMAAIVGVSVPFIRYRYQLDPAMGAHVVVTFFSDSFGFLVFLGMAAIFLT